MLPLTSRVSRILRVKERLRARGRIGESLLPLFGRFDGSVLESGGALRYAGMSRAGAARTGLGVFRVFAGAGADVAGAGGAGAEGAGAGGGAIVDGAAGVGSPMRGISRAHSRTESLSPEICAIWGMKPIISIDLPGSGSHHERVLPGFVGVSDYFDCSLTRSYSRAGNKMICCANGSAEQGGAQLKRTQERYNKKPDKTFHWDLID